jgi:serine/threonine protein kinase
MPISIGSRLGPYEVVSAIGAGGMGEVYRARDTKLGRGASAKIAGRDIRDRSGTRSYFELRAKTERLMASAIAL